MHKEWTWREKGWISRGKFNMLSRRDEHNQDKHKPLQTQELGLAPRPVPAVIVKKIFANNKVTYLCVHTYTYKHTQIHI